MSTGNPSTRTSEADDDVARLVSDLERLAALLDRHGELHWCRWARRSLAEIEQHDPRGLHRIRQAYGGMGSFNDLVLDGEDAAGRSRVNTELDTLRGSIFAAVTALLHDLRCEES